MLNFRSVPNKNLQFGWNPFFLRYLFLFPVLMPQPFSSSMKYFIGVIKSLLSFVSHTIVMLLIIAFSGSYFPWIGLVKNFLTAEDEMEIVSL